MQTVCIEVVRNELRIRGQKANQIESDSIVQEKQHTQ